MVPALSLATLSPLPAALIALLMISIPAASSVCVAAAANPTDAIKQPHRNCMVSSRERRSVVEAGIQIVSETAADAIKKRARGAGKVEPLPAPRAHGYSSEFRLL